jgi:hypothetical protein
MGLGFQHFGRLYSLGVAPPFGGFLAKQLAQTDCEKNLNVLTHSLADISDS